MVDHVHGEDDGRALHDQGGGGQMDHIMKDGLVSLGPEKTFDPSMNALMIVGGTKSFPREDPTEAGTRNVRRRIVVPKRMRKMKVADGGGENKGTIEKYFSNMCVKGMLMNGVSLDFTRNTKRSTEKDDEKKDESLGKRLKMSTTIPEHKTAKKTTGIPRLRKSRGAKSRAREEPRSKGMKEITSYFF